MRTVVWSHAAEDELSRQSLAAGERLVAQVEVALATMAESFPFADERSGIRVLTNGSGVYDGEWQPEYDFFFRIIDAERVEILAIEEKGYGL